CLNQQTRSDNQHHRQSDLGYHKPTTGVMTPCAAGAPCALLECSRHVTRSRAPERDESEKQGSPGREAERKQQNGQIDRKLVHSWTARRLSTDQRPHAGAGQPQSQNAAGSGHHGAFGYRLPEQPAAAGAESSAQYKLTSA